MLALLLVLEARNLFFELERRRNPILSLDFSVLLKKSTLIKEHDFESIDCIPPLDMGKGVPLLGQNRQFQWFNSPTYIYLMVPASAATYLKRKGFDVLWNDAIAEGWTQERFEDFFIKEDIDVMMLETKAPVVKLHWGLVKKYKKQKPNVVIVMVGDHVTAFPEEKWLVRMIAPFEEADIVASEPIAYTYRKEDQGFSVF